MPDSLTKAPKPRPLDDETSAALTLFNTYLVADREQQAHERALRKAEKAKDDAAAAVRKLNDRKAPASEMGEAEAKYREAVEALRRLQDGEAEPPQDSSDEAEEPEEPEQAEASAEAEAPEEPEEAKEPEQADGADGDTQDTPDAPVDKAEAGEQTENTEASADDAGEQEVPEQADSVGVEAPVGDDDLPGDEPAGVAGQQ